MMWKRVLVHFLTAIFAVSSDESSGITNSSIIGINENVSPIRHVFNCPSQPVGGCPKSKGCLYADPDNCHKYYKCVNGIPKPKHCPLHQQWSDIEKECVYKRGPCPTTTTEPTTTTTEPTTTTTEPTTTTTEPTTTTTEPTTTTTEPTTTTIEPTTTTTEPTTTTTEPTTTTIEPTTTTCRIFMACPAKCTVPNTSSDDCSFADPDSCISYIFCKPDGNSTVETCPIIQNNQFEWDDNIKVCVSPPSPTCCQGNGGYI